MPTSTNKKILVRGNYRTQDKLMLRKSYNSFMIPHISLDKELINKIKKLKVKSILDAGCGNGDLLIALRKSGFAGLLTGIDLSKGMLKSGIRQNSREKLGIKFIVADAEKLPFKDKSFDLVISKHMLYHLPNPQKGVNEMYRCLKNNGFLMITLNSKKDLPLVKECGRFVCKKYKLTEVFGSELVNVENVRKFLKSFTVIDVKFKEGRINKAEMFPAFFESFRDYYEPQPSEKMWVRIMKDVREFVERKTASKGEFTEKRIRGIIFARKI